MSIYVGEDDGQPPTRRSAALNPSSSQRSVLDELDHYQTLDTPYTGYDLSCCYDGVYDSHAGEVLSVEDWFIKPFSELNDTTDQQLMLTFNQGAGEGTSNCGAWSLEYGLSSNHYDNVNDFVARGFTTNDLILPPFSAVDDATDRLQMLNINNGVQEDSSPSGPDCGLMPTPRSPNFYANSICSPSAQSTAVIGYRSVTGAFPAKGHGCNGYYPGFQSSVPNHHFEYRPSQSSLDNLSRDFYSRIERSARPSTKPVVRLDLRSLKGTIVELACDRYYCKYLQKTIQHGLDEEEIEILFKEMIHDINVLMMHRYGNYVVQQLVEICTEEQRYTMISWLTTKYASDIANICSDQHGTRVFQKLLAKASTRHERAALVSAVAPNVVELSVDGHGQYVIRRCLDKFSSEDNAPLFAEVARNCRDIATDQNGCCLIQKCVDFSKGDQRQLLVDAIAAHSVHLSYDNYGNYVVQHILKLANPGFIDCILHRLKGNFPSLCCDKYASNVVECCLKLSERHQYPLIIKELLANPNLLDVILNEYGNYVFGSAVKYSLEKGLGEVYNILQGVIYSNLESMSTGTYGQKLLAQLKRKQLLHPEIIARLRKDFF